METRKRAVVTRSKDSKLSNDASFKEGAKDIVNKPIKKLRKSTKKDAEVKFKTVQPAKIDHLINTLIKFQSGFKSNICREKSIINSVAEGLRNLEPYSTVTPFARRVMAMQWHPQYRNVLVTASKGGELYSWNLDDSSKDNFISGTGPGGTITAMKINVNNSDNVFVSSLTAEVVIHNFEKRTAKTLFVADGDRYRNWFVSLDVNFKRNLLAAGDCKGTLYFSDCDGNNKWKCLKLHSEKISHVEFHPKDENLIVTSSVDSYVKLWDLRSVKGALQVIKQKKENKPINSACFSKTDGATLLATNQHEELFVYKAPFWEETQTIRHPHRFFQYISHIKASWHPTSDIAVVGRYPSVEFLKDDERTLDFYNVSNGIELCRLKHPSVTGILPLNEFNYTGECLASATGCHVIIWKSKILREQKIVAMAKSCEINTANRTKKTTKPKLPGKSTKNVNAKTKNI